MINMTGGMSSYDAVDEDVNIALDKFPNCQHPLESASVLSEFLFTWATPIIKLGARRHLEVDDIYPVPSFLGSKKLADEISVMWMNMLDSQTTPRLAWALVKCFWRPLVFSTISFTVFVASSAAQPYLVTSILTYVGTGSTDLLGITSGIAVAVLMGIASLTAAFGFSMGWYFVNHLSLRVKTSLICLIYDKSLTISVQARQRYTTGDIMTLVSVDVERIWMALGVTCWYWIVPAMCSLGIAMLYMEVGWSAGYCAVVLVVWAVLQGRVGAVIGQLRDELVAFTAHRVHLTKEVLQGIRLVKLYAWEGPVEESIAAIRDKELHILRKYQVLKMISTVSFVVFC